MRIVVISDTHGGHEELALPSGDVLIHCGDFENLFQANPDAILQIDDWFKRQEFDLVLCTGGNHDHLIQECLNEGRQPFEHAVFLKDEAFAHRGVTFHGSPWVPHLDGHAFFADDDRLRDAWAAIPDDVDVLITHTPPAGILDISSTDLMLGCACLAERLVQLGPKLHCFGHVHASAGTCQVGTTTFVNASSVGSDFRIKNEPFVIDLPDRD